MKSPMLLLLTTLMLAPVTVYATTSDHANSVFLSKSVIEKRQSTIKRIEDYLSNLKSIVSSFQQVAPDGTLTTGKFYLKRPGKMRWQYNPPTPILMVSNGSTLVYYDYELEQVSHVSLDSTLIGLLAHDKIRFDGKIGITELAQDSGAIRISLAQRDKPTEGELMLEFSDKPLTLQNMVIRDATNQITSVALTDAKFGVALDDKLFIFRDPRKGKKFR